MTELSPKEITYIQKMSTFGVLAGMPRSTALVFGFFMICEPRKQSAADVRRLLKLSLGSVSNALQALVAMRILTSSSELGERKMLYEIQPQGLVEAVRQKVEGFEQAKSLALEGQRLKQDSDERMAAFYDIYTVLGNAVQHTTDDLFEKWRHSD